VIRTQEGASQSPNADVLRGADSKTRPNRVRDCGTLIRPEKLDEDACPFLH
jgi:hypothetical protein